MKKLFTSGGSTFAIAIAAGIMAQASPALAWAGDSVSADDQQDNDQSYDSANEIVVVGSQIKGAKTTGAVPVSIVSAAEIASVGAVSSNDLFRAIPQAGSVTFTGLPNGGGQNAARGDISTVSLRGMGLGTTLSLINGRRLVQHPTTVNVDGAPQIGFNVNAVPVGGIERVEVLRDGAAALYGSDAIAGVVNTVLQSDMEGGSVDLQHGFAEGTKLKETTFNGSYGSSFAGGRGHVSVMGTLYARSGQLYSDLPYTATQDLRDMVEDPSFAGHNGFDGRQQASAWGQFLVPAIAGLTGPIRQNGTAITSAAGVFSFVPCTNGGTLAPSNNAGVCIRNGANTGNADRNVRQDIPRTFENATAIARARRANFFLFSNYEISDKVEAFSELSYYYAETRQLDQNAQIVQSFPITVAANAYWNPFGPVGSPNRLPGLDIPAEGMPVTITSYAPVETGPRQVDVRNDQFRLLFGLRGDLGAWNWESAAVYSEAKVRDTSDALSNSLFQAAVNRTTADAYNPFSGGDPLNPSTRDSTLSDAATVQSFMMRGVRMNKASLAMADLKLSNARLLPIWGGDIGIALGAEIRRETYSDDRDARQDGTITFVDSVTGLAYGTDFAMSSPRPDVSGRRTVFSAYGELAVPLVSEDMKIPLVRTLDVQIAGRFEHYNDLGSVAKPKVAAAWDLVNGVRVRGSYSGGFRAPTLEAMHIPASGLTSNGNMDYIRCEADLRAGRIADWSKCDQRFSGGSTTAGNKKLKPENSNSYSVGVVLEPKFIPSHIGRFTFTFDRFWISMSNVVSSLDRPTLLGLDYLARVNGGSTDSVVRAPVTQDDIDFFAGTGIAPAGIFLSADTSYQNMLPLDIEGMDFSVNYVSPTSSIGRFSFTASANKMIRYEQQPLLPQQLLLEAQKAGTISSGFVAATGTGNLVGLGSRPKWRGTASLNWTLDNWSAGAFVQYTDAVSVTSIINAAGEMYRVKSHINTNLNASYTVKSGALENARFTIGARNIFDKDPPLANGGYLGGLYQAQGRYLYGGVGYKF
jgi:iron complex outermembrane receptor protein